jgi:carbon-monoxide dehydrogenase large subunit
LAREKVRYVGEPVVALLAENRYLAEDALDRIEIAYEPLGTVVDPEMAVRADAPLLHEEAGTNVLAMREFARGDVEETIAAAPIRVGGRFRFHRKTPLAIENRACLAEYDRGRRSFFASVNAASKAGHPSVMRVSCSPYCALIGVLILAASAALGCAP